MKSIRSWLAPPHADDPEEALRAKIIHWLVTTALLFVVPLTVLIPLVEDESVKYTLPLYLLSLVGGAGILFVLHRGHTQTASVLLATLGWVVTLWASFASGGVGSPQLALAVLVIMLTAFLWSGGAAIGMALFMSVSLFGMEFARDMGLAPQPFIVATRFTTWAALTTVLALSAVFLQIFVGSVNAARDDAAEKSRRLEEEMQRRAETEASLHRAQKLEALGRLTGGIAHDFNNILTVLLVEAEALYASANIGRPLTDSEREHVLEIRGAAERASALTRQLLAFSRHPVGVPQVIDPDRSIQKLEPMLRRLIREDVTLHIRTEAGGAAVQIDSGQFEQVVMNLVLNASDAMPRGGELTLASSLVTLDAGFTALHPGMRPGAYASLEVRDNGAGIAEADLERIFDPFFTTKEIGQGTGLGLASAHGIITKAGGDITVESEIGRGTTFRVYLPEVARAATGRTPTRKAPVEANTALGTLLLVEDDPSVRRITKLALERAGYRVVAADRAEEALDWLRQHDTHVDLLISDVIMPGMNGGELAIRVAAERPGIRVLLVSGYTSNVLEASGLSPDVALLEKPFTPAILLARVEELVGGP